MSSDRSLVARPTSSGSPQRAAQLPSPPRMMIYEEKPESDIGIKARSIDVSGKSGSNNNNGGERKKSAKVTLDWMRLETPSEEYLREIFSFFDTNHTGSISKKEFRNFMENSMENYGAPVDKRDLDRQFSKYDKNNNGELNFDEFSCLILSRLKM